jgi:hypothetical protein
MLLGVHSPTLCADVRLNDPVTSGVLVALHGEPGGGGYRLRVLPRLYRKVCSNGAVLISTGTVEELDPRLLLNAGEPERLIHAIMRMTAACFEPGVFQATVNHFRRSASEPASETFSLLMEAGLNPLVIRSMFRRYTERGDFTRWGLGNAVTAEARTASGALMLELEQLGGVLLAGSRAERRAREVLGGVPPREAKKAAAA